jgi:hypothetical protein
MTGNPAAMMATPGPGLQGCAIQAVQGMRALTPTYKAGATGSPTPETTAEDLPRRRRTNSATIATPENRTIAAVSVRERLRGRCHQEIAPDRLAMAAGRVR